MTESAGVHRNVHEYWYRDKYHLFVKTAELAQRVVKVKMDILCTYSYFFII